MMNTYERLKTAMAQNSAQAQSDETAGAEQATPEEEKEDHNQIVTTAEELEGFYAVKALLRDVVASRRISFKDNRYYMSILLDGNSRKWICRLDFNGKKKYVRLPATDKSVGEISIPLKDIDEIYQHRQELVDSLQRRLAAEEHEGA